VNSKTIVACVILLLCVCGGFYFYTQWDLKRFNASLPSPPPPTQQAPAQNLLPEQGERLSRVETATSAAVESVQAPMVDTSDAPLPEVETSDALLETAAGSEDLSNVEEPEELYYGDYTMEELVDIRDWAKDLDAKLRAEYPDMLELTQMTPEEIAQRYPTEKDRVQLAKRGQEVLNFYLEEYSGLMQVVPTEIRIVVISQLHEQLAANWGQEAADQAMAKLHEMIKN